VSQQGESDSTSAEVTTMARDDDALVPAERGEPGEKPVPVEEAERALRRWGAGLAGTGAVGSAAYWFALLQLEVFFPLQWWITFLVALVALFFFPPNRGPRFSREILRRWDDLQIERALEEGGASPAPEVRVAEQMARRVTGHPSVDGPVAQVAADLLRAIRRTAQDRRTIQLLQRSGAWEARDAPRERTLSDVLDYIVGREGELLASLEGLHRAVVRRDAAAAREVGSQAQDLLARLEAEEEVEKLLEGND
jgi:hypothetical protein